MPDTSLDLPARVDIGTIQVVLDALADPVRLEIVRRLAVAPEQTSRCQVLYDGISKSTASHHFKVLREAGLTERLYVDGQLHQQLRSNALERRYPGLLGSVLDGLGR